ncbi:hypothetical protein M5362_25300 [Streptomyces sp. Je 1-79]|uniref:hypothetical protein n=1 Tax=Streptomyces sp. Je 1-79 TaxID=2943847 RepID=UPI0021A7D1BF|nr:hypothetical protein [Streptomyces sp. Je 1-79]MCT4356450.1 hypothetical protein [Streptomyces sp. Je 1-79]
MDLEALRHANFALLSAAITDWGTVVKSLTGLQKRASDDMKAKADKANWAGVNATVSREFISKTAGEFSDALTQATSIHNILKDTHDELVGFRDKLKQALDDGFDKDKLSVYGEQGGGFRVVSAMHPEPPGTKEKAEALRDRIQVLLGQATTSDSTAARALKAIAEQADYGFSGAKHADRDSAADALQKADAMANLAKDAKKMSPEELAEFQRTMAKYKDDELFAAQFASKLGGKETLQFWNDLAELHAGARGEELKQLQSLQRDLSTTLATATLSDSDGMTEWKKKVLDESTTAFRANSADPLRPYGAMGYQVMSSLMHHGKYDAEFLDAYGKQLLKMDMAPAGSAGMGTNDLWKDGNITDLVFGDDDGRDPVTGFMKALSHNPEAALDTFGDKKVFEHVVESMRYTDRDGAVAHALEAAVTGYGDGEKATDIRPHSREQVALMQDVMHAVAQPDSGTKLVNKETGESFGDMAAAYMPEINRSIAGSGSESIFMTNSQDPDGLKKTDAMRFLYDVSKDPMGRAAIIIGENIYTASSMEAHIANPDLFNGKSELPINAIARNTGIIEGIVGHSVADAKIAGDLGAEKATNDALKSKGDVVKAFLAAGVNVGSVALVPMGPGAAMTGAAASGFFGGVAGIAVDTLLKGQEAQGALDRSLYASGGTLNDTMESAKAQTQNSVGESISTHGSKELTDHEAKELVRVALEQGWTDSDSMMEDIRARPAA